MERLAHRRENAGSSAVQLQNAGQLCAGFCSLHVWGLGASTCRYMHVLSVTVRVITLILIFVATFVVHRRFVVCMCDTITFYVRSCLDCVSVHPAASLFGSWNLRPKNPKARRQHHNNTGSRFTFRALVPLAYSHLYDILFCPFSGSSYNSSAPAPAGRTTTASLLVNRVSRHTREPVRSHNIPRCGSNPYPDDNDL